MKTLFASLLLMALAVPVVAQEWIDRSGQPVPQSSSIQSRNGFGGALLVTPDLDWAEKWNTPREVTPHFSRAETVRVGEPVTVLVFFGNPAADRGGRVHVSATIALLRPDGSAEIAEKPLNCFDHAGVDVLESIRLCESHLQLTPTAEDPKGTWAVRVRLTDENRQSTVVLEEQFVVQ